jgi:hypothetical protein
MSTISLKFSEPISAQDFNKSKTASLMIRFHTPSFKFPCYHETTTPTTIIHWMKSRRKDFNVDLGFVWFEVNGGKMKANFKLFMFDLILSRGGKRMGISLKCY